MRYRHLVSLFALICVVAACGDKGISQVKGSSTSEVDGASRSPLRSLGVHFNPDTGLLVLTGSDVATTPGQFPDLQIAFSNIGPRSLREVPATCRGGFTYGDPMESAQVSTKLQYRPSGGGAAPLGREMIISWAESELTLRDCGDLDGSHLGQVGSFPAGAAPAELADDGRIWEVIPILVSKVTGFPPSLPVRLPAQLSASASVESDQTWIAPVDLNVQVARITRSSVDRPGPNVWDVKVVYATFKGGPDSYRDTNGQLATLTSNIGSYFARQRPGYQLRFDTFKSQLDIQHIALPVTAVEFADLFTDDGRALEDFMHMVFADAGLSFSWGIHRNSTYGVEKRMYLMYMEGPRGIKYGNNSAIDYQCGRVSEFQAGGRIVGINLRDGAGRVCPGMAAFESNKSRWWEASRDAVRFLAGSLTELPGCDSVTRDEIARPAPQRVENNITTRDVLSNSWMIPRNEAEEPVLDLNRNLYFNIKSGPHLGDRCRDIQYSPFWQELPTTKPKAGNPKGRAVVDLPDETDEPKLKVYYVVPNDGVDQRLDLTLTPMMITADAWLKNQTGQIFRWDTYRGKLDVMFVRLLETEAQLWQSDEPGLECWDIPCPSPGRLYGILTSRGLVGANEIAVILYDGKQSPVQPRPSGCYAGPRFIVGYSMCLSGSVDTKLVESAQGSLGIRIMHEVFHTLGAVGEGAPNGDGGFGHIVGDSNDIMAIGARTGWSVDPGRDDYWGHGRTDLTDISRSVFLVPAKAGAEFPNRWNQ